MTNATYMGPLVFVESLPDLGAINVEISPFPTPQVSARLKVRIQAIPGVSSVVTGSTGDFYVQVANELFTLSDLAQEIYRVATVTARGEPWQTVRVLIKPAPHISVEHWLIQTDRQHHGRRLLKYIAGALHVRTKDVRYCDPYNILVWIPFDWSREEIAARVTAAVNEYYDNR